MRLKDLLWHAAHAYLDHPCAVSACPCACHSIHHVPQADYVRELLDPTRTKDPRYNPNSPHRRSAYGLNVKTPMK
jgi:hypothetical protein